MARNKPKKRPTQDTNVPPPGPGEIEAIVETMHRDGWTHVTKADVECAYFVAYQEETVNPPGVPWLEYYAGRVIKHLKKTLPPPESSGKK